MGSVIEWCPLVPNIPVVADLLCYLPGLAHSCLGRLCYPIWEAETVPASVAVKKKLQSLKNDLKTKTDEGSIACEFPSALVVPASLLSSLTL